MSISGKVAAFVLALVWCPLGLAECVHAAGDRVLAGELAALEPAFARLPPDTPLLAAPLPGVRRILTMSDATKLAAANGIPAEPRQALCIERAGRRLDGAEILAAIRKALVEVAPADAAEAKTDLVDFSLHPVPEGMLVFSRQGLAASPASPPGVAVLWRGRVVPAVGRPVPIWARLKLVKASVVPAATRSLPAGTILTETDFHMETRSQFILAFLTDAGPLCGRRLRRNVGRGETIRPQDLGSKVDVAPGQEVDVEVDAGGIRLRIPAQAESSGSAGQTIWLRAANGTQRFRAKVTGPGKANVEVHENADESLESTEGGDIRPGPPARRLAEKRAARAERD